MVYLPHKPVFSVQLFFLIYKYFSVARKDKSRFSFSPGARNNLQFCFLKCLVRNCPDPEVTDMYIRYSVQKYVPVKSGKTVEILILTPTSGCPLKYLNRQFILPLFQIACQLKIRRCKTVLTVPYKNSIQPNCQTTFRSLEGNEDPLPFHPFRDREIFHIACHRIKIFRDLPRPDILPAFPWILCIGILWDVIPFHLDMSRHPDIIPG